MRLAVGLVALLPACIDTDPAVFVEATLDAPTLAVQTSALATGLEGALTASLHLGPRASGPSASTLSVVSLLDAAGSTTLAPTLGFTASPGLPVTVPVDGTVLVALAFAAKNNQLPADQATTICGKTLTMRVVLDDSLRGVPTTVESPPFTASACN